MADGSLKAVLPRPVPFSIEELTKRDPGGFGAAVKAIADAKGVSVDRLVADYNEYVACKAAPGTACVADADASLDKLAMLYGQASDKAVKAGLDSTPSNAASATSHDGETKPSVAEGTQPAASLPDVSATGLLEGLVSSESPDRVAALARLPGGELFAPYVEPIRSATGVTTSAPEGLGTAAGAGLLAGGIVANAVAPLVTTVPDSDGAARAATPPLNTIEITSGGKGGWSKELNNPAPNTIYKVDGAFTYTTDELGRVRQVEATLSLETSKSDRNNHQQCKAGKCGLGKDEGGHLIATVLGGPGEAINLVPMDANLNRGLWRTMEKEWQNAVENDKKVEVSIEPVYTDNSKRPSSFKVNYRMGGDEYVGRNFTNYSGEQ